MPYAYRGELPPDYFANLTLTLVDPDEAGVEHINLGGVIHWIDEPDYERVRVYFLPDARDDADWHATLHICPRREFFKWMRDERVGSFQRLANPSLLMFLDAGVAIATRFAEIDLNQAFAFRIRWT